MLPNRHIVFRSVLGCSPVDTYAQQVPRLIAFFGLSLVYTWLSCCQLTAACLLLLALPSGGVHVPGAVCHA
jgi:hypothetical protein